MGSITNLATTGNYTAEANGLKVSFDFVVDNKTAKITNITSGQVTDQDGKALAAFTKGHHGGIEPRDRMSYSLEKGYETDAVSAAVQVISAFEAKLAEGKAAAVIE